ncbi:MAG: uroporphyrinogen-III synthase [Salinibacter sp.]
MDEPPDVILLRSADAPDRYQRAFAEAGVRAVCEPVLTFAFPNQQALADHLGRHDRYGALVATSPRSATALRRLFEEQADLAEAWQDTPAFAVGPKTARRLQEVGLQPRGEDAGDAEALADRIVEAAPSTPLLFLCGNRRRETLPDRLRAADVSFEELIVYETRTRQDLTLPPSRGASAETWLVFFSPSGLEAVQQADTTDLGTYRVAAIGPTTAGALEEAGYAVEAVAREPSPDALVTALEDETG